MAVAVKRERSSNWSLAEITILTDFVEKNEEVLKAKQNNLITNAKKNSKWAEVTDLVNAVGVQRRSVEQVKFKCGNLQQGAKKTFTEARKHARKTGGGPPLKPPTAAEEKLIDLMKDRPNFSGIAGGFESSMPTTSAEMPSSPKSASTSSSTFESTSSTLEFSQEATAPSTEGDKTTSRVQIKRRKISFEQLQKMQYEKKNIELQNMKLQKDLERADLEKQNMELQNSKLALQIECLKQTVTQNENALLALQAITDE
ncbi:myb/SANT-like DNA-binding domain-containing protein 4 [Magallana gigas]|uniref:myb/SANT-like DNA-binding domain-containing protein 4 n=1 Tax=Magallana gigas TaxID=29159 RepID=UPI0033410D77